MMQYLPVSSEAAARNLSAALWDLASPPNLRQPDNTTIYFCGWEQDVNNQWYLQLLSDYTLLIHPGITQAMLDAVVTQIEQQEDALP